MDTESYPQARLRTEYAEFILFWVGILTFLAGIITSSIWATVLGFFLTLFTGLVGFRPD
jgi:hypothetical protein